MSIVVLPVISCKGINFLVFKKFLATQIVSKKIKGDKNKANKKKIFFISILWLYNKRKINANVEK